MSGTFIIRNKAWYIILLAILSHTKLFPWAWEGAHREDEGAEKLGQEVCDPRVADPQSQSLHREAPHRAPLDLANRKSGGERDVRAPEAAAPALMDGEKHI